MANVATLEDLIAGVRVHGLRPDGPVEVVQVAWHGSAAVTLTFRDKHGATAERVLYRADEAKLRVEAGHRAGFAFDADPELFRLVSEATRLKLAHLFDPYLAVSTSDLEPLPHQITAVYEEMLPRQPLRFLLADDPGAGKTIMAGLLIKELIVRGDLKRCLIVAPGSLTEQWQSELHEKLGLTFELVTRSTIHESASGNPFAERDLVVSRLDHLARNDNVRAKLRQTDWDLVVVDEAHKMSASYFGGEVKPTQRYGLGVLLGEISRHLLLMTATPHSGKEEQFQLFLRLLDPDRFEGVARKGSPPVDLDGVMRRLIKEKLLKFDGRPLFPERRAQTIAYELSDEEQELHEQVTAYVREEMNRAERLGGGPDARRGAVVGFALTVLQRRLASSPEAILRSIQRRRERLERRIAEAQRDPGDALAAAAKTWTAYDEDDIEELTEGEGVELEQQVVDQASAAQTLAELRNEVAVLEDLQRLARRVRLSGADRKWEQLSQLLSDEVTLRASDGARRKLIVFTEHRDTLEYLRTRIGTLLGGERVVAIHGGVSRPERRRAQDTFVHDPDVWVLVATDAAGEGVNLQRANLLVNYDLPWNPNRLEQRFGRIHRIGQREVCHMWNLVAAGTREGDVLARLLTKLETQGLALGGQVFDVLSELFEGEPLRDLLLEAIRYGERPEVKARLDEVVDATVGDKLREKVRERALVSDVLSPTDVDAVRERMEQARARRLQPHFVRSFFLEAFARLGGRVARREPGRWQITQVPAALRERAGDRGLPRGYERVTFEKERVADVGLAPAELLAPGHPLLDATLALLLERHGALLRRGAVLVADDDPGEVPRVLLKLQDTIASAASGDGDGQRAVSRRLTFAAVAQDGQVVDAGYAPHLDLRAPTDDELALVAGLATAPWTADVERVGLDHAIEHAVPEHLEEVRSRIGSHVARTLEAVHARLTQQIAFWDRRAEELKDEELAGKKPKLNSGLARQRAEDLEARRARRVEQLEAERELAPLPPRLVGGAFVVPAGLLARLRGERDAAPTAYATQTKRVDRLAVDAVLAAEVDAQREPKEMDHSNPGFDVLSRDPVADELLFIEVKGRVGGAHTFKVSRNQILTALNKPETFRLAMVRVEDDDSTQVRYLREPFDLHVDASFPMASIEFRWDEMWARGEAPARSTKAAGEAVLAR